MIKLKDCQFLQYQLNFDIDQNINTIIYSKNNNILKKIALELAGINKSNNIFYNNKEIYDNKEYFNSRIYIDCNIKYLNTLLARNISKNLEKNYKIIIDINKFEKFIKELQIRRFGKLNNEYNFNSEGIALSDITLALSIYKYHILFEPLKNINSNLSLIKEELNNTTNLMFTSNLDKYDKISNQILVLGFTSIFYMREDSIIYIINEQNQEKLIDEFSLINNIIYKSVKTQMLILDSSVNSKFIVTYKKYIKQDTLINIDKYIDGDSYEN